MRILFLSGGETCNYLRDMLAHGLRSILGPDLVDAIKLDSLYDTFVETPTRKLYGCGFTLYRLLPDISVDRTEIDVKIRSRYYDLVIFGSVPRIDENGEHFFLLGLVRDHYPASKIVYLDGEDDPILYMELMRSGLYFKRELHRPEPHAIPIGFAIPACKLSAPEQFKDLIIAPLNPWDPRTYVYTDEDSYYRDYRRSLYGRTSKKGGWDCLRHYEIMAAQCMPYFENLEHCPAMTMTWLPKAELLLAKHLIDYADGALLHTAAGRDLWQDLMGRVHSHLRRHLTTEALAEYVLDTAARATGSTVEMAGAALG